MLKIYLYDNNNEYIGESITMLDPEETRLQGKEVWLMPPNSTTLKPELKKGYAPVWNSETWDYVEDHRGKKGYVGKTVVEIQKLGPLPDGFTTEKPEMTSEELKEQHRQEILSNLTKIDQLSSRSLRAVLAAQLSGQEPEKADVDKLTEYEALAKSFRKSLSELTD